MKVIKGTHKTTLNSYQNCRSSTADHLALYIIPYQKKKTYWLNI